MNLRAALYRALTELKKNGVLGREIVLRKTMLDECKGDKFEEAIAAFAMIVLRKVSRQRSPAELGLVNGLEPIERQMAFPILLAYRHTLQQRLHERRELQEKAASFHHQLSQRKKELRQRASELRANSTNIADDQRSTQKLLNSAWVADRKWLASILQLEEPRSEILELNFDEAWNSGAISDRSSKESSKAMTETLDGDLQVHMMRMQKWRSIRHSIQQLDCAPVVVARDQSQEQSSSPQSRFTLHRNPKIMSNADDQKEVMHLHSEYQLLQESLKMALAEPPLRRQVAIDRSRLKHPIMPKSSTTRAEGVLNITISKAVPMGKIEERLPLSSVKSTSSQFMTSDAGPISDNNISTLVPKNIQTASSLQNQGVHDHEKASVLSQESESKYRSSLADRTRRSMALLKGESSLSPSATEDSNAGAYATPPVKPKTVESGHSAISSLADRTQQSMSGLSEASHLRRRSKATRHVRQSQSFPTSQLETPGKPRRNSQDLDGISIPPEILLDGQADYNSVFKSRPKLAMSPVLSPDRHGSSIGDKPTEKFSELDLGESSD